MTTTKTIANAHFDKLIAHYEASGWQHSDRGASAALLAYDQSVDLGLDALAVKEMPFLPNMPAFLACLEEAGIAEFLLCDRSSGLMEALHCLLANGWQMCGPCEVKDRSKPLPGLRIRKAAA